MKKEDIDHFRSIYPQWWSEALKSMPAGHVQLLARLYHQCDLIAVDDGDIEPWVTLHFERLDDEGGLFRASAAPTVDFERWTDGSALALIIALQFFNERQRQTCETCGLPGGRHCMSPDFCNQKAEHFEDLRARQRQSIMQAQQRQLGLEYLRKTEMKPENIERIRVAHPELFHPSVANVPDGWAEFILVFLKEFHDLGEGMTSPGDIRFERTNSGLKAHVWANPEMNWTPEKSWELLKWQCVLYKSSRDACEWCAKLGAQPVPLGERESFFLCDEHKASAEEKLAAQVQAFDARVRFRDEMAILFQPMSVMSIQVRDQNLHILRKALRDIKKLVEERELIGQVFVTRVEESEGQLFINARCSEKVDPATQFEIADIVHHAQWQSDQASLAANKESDDDA